MTFKVIRGQGQGHVRLKVSKMTIFKIYLLHHFSTNQKISNGFWYQTKISKISQARFLIFLLVIESCDFKVCQKKLTSSDLNDTWYDVRGRWNIHDDVTFKVIRGQVQGEEMTSVLYRDYFLCMLPIAVARSSSGGIAIRYVLPVLWMTSCCHTMEPIGGQTGMVLCTSLPIATGGAQAAVGRPAH